MAQLPHSGLETTPAGTANVQGIIDANWTALEAKFNPANNHESKADAASLAFDRDAGAIQEASVTQNTAISVSNLALGQKIDIIIITDAARSVTVPGAWTAAGTTTLATTSAGALVITAWNTSGGVVYMTNP